MKALPALPPSRERSPSGVPLLARFDACSSHHIIKLAVRDLAVVRDFPHAEIDAPAGLVGITFIDKTVNHLDDLSISPVALG